MQICILPGLANPNKFKLLIRSRGFIWRFILERFGGGGGGGHELVWSGDCYH